MPEYNQNFFDLTPEKTNLNGPKRELKVIPIEGKATISSTGLIDRGLFTGENTLHALMDRQTTLWSLKQGNGILPPVLRQSFTSYSKLYKFAEDYYKRRNIELKEVKN